MKANEVSSAGKKMTKVRWESTLSIRYYETSPLDISRAWFNDKDYKEFKLQSKILARLVQEIGADAFETSCNDSYRGLEYIVEGEKREIRNTRRELAWAVVLENDPDQLGSSNDQGKFAWKKITTMYRAVSRDALKDAQIRAAQNCEELGIASSPLSGRRCRVL
jgi:hypothetical protein